MNYPNATKNPNKYTPIILIVIALALAGLAAWAAISYLEKREETIRQEIVGDLKKVRVVVASRNTEVGETASASNMSVREIPETYVPDMAIFPQDFDRIVGLKLTQPLTKGKPLLRTSLKGLTGVSTFSELIPVGYRAVTLEVDVLSTNESLIVAGDYIDIALVRKKGSESSINGAFQVLLQKVLVMATGPITISEPPVNVLGYAEELYRYQSITISVAEEDISKIYSVTDGRFTFLVRNPDDTMIAGYNQSSSTGKYIETLAGGSSQNGILKTTLISPAMSNPVQMISESGGVTKVKRFAKYSSSDENQKNKVKQVDDQEKTDNKVEKNTDKVSQR